MEDLEKSVENTLQPEKSFFQRAREFNENFGALIYPVVGGAVGAALMGSLLYRGTNDNPMAAFGGGIGGFVLGSLLGAMAYQDKSDREGF